MNYQYTKFAIVGATNTTIDFLIFNALIFSIGSVDSVTYALFKAIAFGGAVVNSYLLNKYWVFAYRGERPRAERLKFLSVSITGFLLNVTASSIAFSLLQMINALNLYLVANISAVIGTIGALALNYAGYKLFVFKPPKSHESKQKQSVPIGRDPRL